MEKQLLIVEKKKRVYTLILNRPERRNALNIPMLSQMIETLGRIRDEDKVRCVVIRGAGDKAFSSGYDISDIPTNSTPEQAVTVKNQNPLQKALKAVLDFPFPVIAMINGDAFGAGCDLTMACDIRIATENARLGLPPAKLGIIYHPDGILRMINIVGLANAKEIFFTGGSYTAQKAREMGLVNHVLPDNQITHFTYEMAHEIVKNAPLSLKGMKVIFTKIALSQKLCPDDIAEIETLRFQAFNSEDLKEGQRAFKEKRKPVFKGK